MRSGPDGGGVESDGSEGHVESRGWGQIEDRWSEARQGWGQIGVGLGARQGSGKGQRRG